MEKMSIKNGGHGGTIINIASAAGLQSAQFYPSIPYFVSKSAVVSLTKSLANSNILVILIIFKEHGFHCFAGLFFDWC